MILKNIILMIGLHWSKAELSEEDNAKKYGAQAEEFCEGFYNNDENTKVKYLGEN